MRLRTLKGDAYRAMTFGLATTAFSGFLLRVPGWARERQRQMEDIAARLTESTSG